MSYPRVPVIRTPDWDRKASDAINALLSNPLVGATLVDAVDDAAAATAGVPVGRIYRNGSVLMVRVA